MLLQSAAQRALEAWTASVARTRGKRVLAASNAETSAALIGLGPVSVPSHALAAWTPNALAHKRVLAASPAALDTLCMRWHFIDGLARLQAVPSPVRYRAARTSFGLGSTSRDTYHSSERFAPTVWAVAPWPSNVSMRG